MGVSGVGRQSGEREKKREGERGGGGKGVH